MIKKVKNILYFIGPNFTVNSLAKPHINFLTEKCENLIVISEGPKIESSKFKHVIIPFVRRNIGFINDIKAVIKILMILLKYTKNEEYLIFSSTPKISILLLFSNYIFKRKYIHIHRGAYYQNLSGYKYKLFLFIDKLVIKNSFETRPISISLYLQLIKTVGLKNKLIRPKFNSSKGVNNKFFFTKKRKSSQNLLYVGRVDKDKGIEHILNLFNELNDDGIKFSLTIVGRIELDKKLNSIFFQYLNKNNFTYYEWINDTSKLYKNYDVLIFPSLREGFGNVIIEANASGLPVVAYDITGVKDAIIDGETGFLCKNYVEFKKRIKYLINNPNFTTKMGRQASSHVKKYFNEKKVISSLLKIK